MQLHETTQNQVRSVDVIKIDPSSEEPVKETGTFSMEDTHRFAGPGHQLGSWKKSAC